ncbi:neurogenic locus notch homolog protein 1-like isoform X2 [Rhopilema esculentum]
MPLNECKKHCLLTRKCKSVNYKETQSENYCQLNSETISSKPNDVIQKTDWIHFATDQTSRLIGSQCEKTNPCSSESTCIDQCDCPGYQCLPCDSVYEMAYKWYCQRTAEPIVEECRINPCRNKGTCYRFASGNHCICPRGYTGPRCETFVPHVPEGWTFGDGIGGIDIPIIGTKSGSGCISSCMYQFPEANGVTVDFNTQSYCYCEFFQNGTDKNSFWINKRIR